MRFLNEQIPQDTPLPFKSELCPKDQLIHKGILSPDLQAYYYTLSDKEFKQFDVYFIKKTAKSWSEPQAAFFNSEYSEHGMNFSPDGNTLFFSSTRPVDLPGIPPTWHLWKSEKVDGQWQAPRFVDIPNLRDKLLSHPIITNSGTLYFHASNLDYSEMDIYQAPPINQTFGAAEKTSIDLDSGKCTPYVSPDEDYLIFASIGEVLDLIICYPDGKGGWTNPKKLSPKINQQGQGNPYVTPNDQFLFFTVGDVKQGNWQIKWVDISSELKDH
ncbi:MAG: hypothetical protein AAFU64_10975 [Bacteroidota bacterium]